MMRMHMRSIGRRVPRADAKWKGQLLSQLSTDQFRDAFRAGGCSPEQVEKFTEVVKASIVELASLQLPTFDGVGEKRDSNIVGRGWGHWS